MVALIWPGRRRWGGLLCVGVLALGWPGWVAASFSATGPLWAAAGVSATASLSATAGVTIHAGAPAASPAAKITSLNQCYDDLPFQGQVQATYDHGGRLESVLQFAPDVVLANRFNNPLLIARLRERGLHVVTLPEPQSLAEVAQLFDELSAYLPDGAGVAGAARRSDGAHPASLAPGAVIPGEVGSSTDGAGYEVTPLFAGDWPQIWQGKRVLMLQANHYSFGAGTLWDEIVTALGGVNVAPGHGLVSVLPERVLVLDPDVIVTIEGGDFALASRNSLHGALAPLLKTRGIAISPELNGCMAQQLGALVEALRE